MLCLLNDYSVMLGLCITKNTSVNDYCHGYTLLVISEYSCMLFEQLTDLTTIQQLIFACCYLLLS